MERLRHNVALIEARDREERLRISAGTLEGGRSDHGHGVTAKDHGGPQIGEIWPFALARCAF